MWFMLVVELAVQYAECEDWKPVRWSIRSLLLCFVASLWPAVGGHVEMSIAKRPEECLSWQAPQITFVVLSPCLLLLH